MNLLEYILVMIMLKQTVIPIYQLFLLFSIRSTDHLYL